MKIEESGTESGSGSNSQRHGSVDPNLDPQQNVKWIRNNNCIQDDLVLVACWPEVGSELNRLLRMEAMRPELDRAS